MQDTQILNASAAVRQRYSEAARGLAPDLCCAVSYDPKFLAAIPDEVLERDYGCGDPSRYVGAGDVVLDLGSGGGKICFIASQVVGSSGRVIGVDCNDHMLELARRAQVEVARRIGYANVEFRKGQIQDLKLDLDQLDTYLRQHPASTSSDWLRMQEQLADLRRTVPLVGDASIDVVVSNCVLNLVHAADRRQLFREIHRVLKPGGRAVISDIVSDRDVPDALQNDPDLWSGCLSGAFREDLFLAAFEEAGFVAVEILERQIEPWRVIEGIEFRSMTLRAHKLPAAASSESSVITYRGPWKSVQDDAGQVYRRGEKTGVSPTTSAMLAQAPYAGDLLFIGEAGRPGAGCCLPIVTPPNGTPGRCC